MEAAASQTPTTIITSLNDATQEYVQEIPLESRTPLVHGGEVGVVVKLNENDADVHAIMAQSLPKYVIIQSNLNNVYLHLYTENPDVPNALRYTGDYSFGLETRFQVVPATTGTGLVHILSMQNNRYWANFGTGNNWVTAMAVKPEENQSDTHCTLFQPVFVNSNNNRVLKLRHVSSGFYVRLFYGAGHYDHCLSLMGDKDDDVCTFIDWESVVMLPDVIRIKGNNGNHLKAYDGVGYMDFREKADNSSLFDYEVSPSRNGGIRLKSTHFGTYWTSMDNSQYVLLKPASPTVHDTSTVFISTILDGNRVILKCLKNDLLCKMFTTTERDRVLVARGSFATDWHIMQIEEPVISRKINNVIYHLTDARLYNEKGVTLISDDSSNRTHSPFTSELNLKTTVTNTTNWSASVSLTVGGSMSFTAGVPFIAEAELEISAEVSGSYNWGEEKTEKQEVGSVKTITVEPMTRVKASLMATRCSYDIPFSYTQHDVLKSGSTKVTDKNDGFFTSKNGYGYRYEVVSLPLDDGVADV